MRRLRPAMTQYQAKRWAKRLNSPTLSVRFTRGLGVAGWFLILTHPGSTVVLDRLYTQEDVQDYQREQRITLGAGQVLREAYAACLHAGAAELLHEGQLDFSPEDAFKAACEACEIALATALGIAPEEQAARARAVLEVQAWGLRIDPDTLAEVDNRARKGKDE